jgi:hypothetical protein
MNRMTRRSLILGGGLTILGGLAYAGWRSVQRARDAAGRSASM